MLPNILKAYFYNHVVKPEISHSREFTSSFNGHCLPNQHFFIEEDTQMPGVWKDSQLFNRMGTLAVTYIYRK